MMKRALVALAIVLLPATALGQRVWQDAENTNGYVTVAPPSVGTDCFLYQTAPFDIKCYTTIPSGFITVPNGVLEGVAGAITGYTATPRFVQFGASSGGGLAQSTNLQYDGTSFLVGNHVISPQPSLRTFDSSATTTQLTSYPASGTNVANILRVVPRGTGNGSTTGGVQIDNTDTIAGTATESLFLFGRGTTGFVIATNFFLGGSNRPILMGTDDPTGPLQFDLNTSGSSSFGVGDVLFNKSAAQALTKTGGTLSVGTGDANIFNIKTNGTTRIGIGTTGGITLPAFTGGGNQCVFVDNAGLVSVTGSACGTGSGAGGITQLAGDGTAGPGSGSQAFTLVNLPNDVSQAGDLLVTSIAAPATPSAGKARVYVDSTSTSKNLAVINDAGIVNHAAQSIASLPSGLALAGLSDSGAWTTHSFQVPLTACTDYVSMTCVTGATDLGGSNATPIVFAVENDALMRGDLRATNVAAPATPSLGESRIYVDSTSKNLAAKNDAGAINHGMQNFTCGANTFATSGAASGVTTCTQPTFSNVSGSLACGQLPSFTGDVANAACFTKVVGVTDGFGVDWTTSGAWTNNQALITSAGHITATNECNVFATCAASTDLGGTYPGPTVVAMHDGASVQHTTSGTWSNGAILSTDGSGHITTEATATCAQLPALTGQATSSAGSCATKVVGLTDGGGTAWPLQGTALGASSWSGGQMLGTLIGSAGIVSYNPPESLKWAFNGTGMSMGYSDTTVIVPYDAAAGQTLSAVAGTSVFATLGAQWSTSQAPPLYHLQPHARVTLYVNVGYLVVSGTGSVTVNFIVAAVNGSPSTAGNYAAVVSVNTGSTTGGAVQLSATPGSGSAGGDYVFFAYRTDNNSAATVTALNFAASLSAF
jgi:hypothetical protein